MQRERFVLDGLWRCLCPSVDAATLHKTLRRPLLPSRQPVLAQKRTTSTETIAAPPPRNIGQHSQPILTPQPEAERNRRASNERMVRSRWTPLLHSSNAAEKDLARFIHRKWKRRPDLPKSFFSGQGSSEQELDGVRTEIIVEGLRELCDQERQYHGICKAVRYLVTRRNRKADVFLYECLIKANADPENGSAKVVGDLLDEMESTGVLPTPAIYHRVLEVGVCDHDTLTWGLTRCLGACGSSRLCNA
jgi:hypothetical protein